MLGHLQRLWENQPPLVRSNVSVGALVLGGVLVLHLIIPLAIRVLDIQQVFDYLLPPMDILSILIQLLFVLLALNALRITVQFLSGKSVLTLLGVMLGWFSLLLLLLAYVERPSVVEKYIGYAAGRSFSGVSDDFSEMCEQWRQAWSAEDGEFTVTTENLGVLQGQAKEAYKIQDTAIVNFGDGLLDVGLACALDGQPPSDVGRANNYKYTRIRGAEYYFYEELP